MISSATSIRMANAVASDKARSCAASGSTALSPKAKASVQRSIKRWRCCATSCGTSGTACAASSLSCPMRSSSITARRSPSRWREASRAARACSASGRMSARLSVTAGACSLAARRMTSATDSAPAWGSQALTVSCTLFRRCSRRTLGSGSRCRALVSRAMRTSTLPRLRRPTSSSRSAGSYWRSSSGSLNDRSRKRLLTARISRPI